MTAARLAMPKPAFSRNLILLCALFTGASLINLGSAYYPLDPALATARFALVGGTLTIFLLTALSSMRRFVIGPSGLAFFALWAVFGVICVISSAVTEDSAQAVASTVWILAGVPLFLFIAIPSVLGLQANRLIVLALLMSHLGFILASLYQYPELHFEYKGIFGHPNGAGVTAAVVAVGCLAWIVERFQTNRFRGLSGLALIIGFASGLFLVMVSGSRTALLAVIVSSGVSLSLCIKHLRRYHFFLIGTAALALLAFGGTFVEDAAVAEQILQKHMDRVARGDMLSRRDEIWSMVMGDVRPLGNGDGYFSQVVGISSHNSVMRVIGERGPIAALLMIGVALWAMAFAFRQAIRDRGRRPFSAAPVLIAACFWSLSMGEAMFGSLGTGITVAYMLSIGVVVANENRRLQRVEASPYRQQFRLPLEKC